ncbi:Sjoegren syndrome nuclear autoantigen 1 [Amphibalanus amphitrite]|uniref:Sjoegren syndrome nuclear autoantigen 1 n=1 Tax=Amphibalanus amphitrite TaxID=1232801 RepID=A0A6A4X5P5_AMPAM|nr:Sjoegren syndrome nuclear autoantigen 1 [Amphibalanus amphitrite]
MVISVTLVQYSIGRLRWSSRVVTDSSGLSDSQPSKPNPSCHEMGMSAALVLPTANSPQSCWAAAPALTAAPVRRQIGSAMSQHGAALQTFNIELVKTTAREERHRQQLERQAAELQSQLDRCTASLRHKQQLSKEYNRIIAEAEGAYQKILESSQALLSVVKRETVAPGPRTRPWGPLPTLREILSTEARLIRDILVETGRVTRDDMLKKKKKKKHRPKDATESVFSEDESETRGVTVGRQCVIGVIGGAPSPAGCQTASRRRSEWPSDRGSNRDRVWAVGCLFRVCSGLWVRLWGGTGGEDLQVEMGLGVEPVT